MTKLHLKRTLAEEQERTLRKAYKAARRAAKRRRSSDDPTAEGSGSRKQKKKRAHSNDDGHSPPPASSHKPDYDTIRAELEEMRFKEKMWGAFEDDERLAGIDARFSDYYAHVPDRWSRDERDLANPQCMDDNEYAEWVREGMWKKKHAREYEEQAKRDAAKDAQRAREREIKAETSRLERLALEQAKRQRQERQRQREDEYRQQYEQRWKVLLDPQVRDHAPLTFRDIPWPFFLPRLAERKASDTVSFHVEDITPEAVSAFLLPDTEDLTTPAGNAGGPRRNREKLKEALLRFHPDKFEGRFMNRVIATDIESVREAVGQVTRVINTLMGGKS